MPGRWRPSAALVALVAVSLAWYSGVWSLPGQRIEDDARLAELARAAGVLAFVAAWWSTFCGDVMRMHAVVLVLQTACVTAAAAAAWAWTRAVRTTVAVALIALSAPFARHWLDRPAGGADAVTVLAMIAVIGAGTSASRRAAVLQTAGAFAAVLFSGWPALAVLAYALVMRGRVAVQLAVAVAAALAARLAIGFPPARALGSLDATDPSGVAIVRTVVALAFAAPAVVYLVTRPPVAVRVRAAAEAMGRSPFAAAAAALILVAVAAFARPGGDAALYVAELAVVLALASAMQQFPALPVRRAAVWLTAALVVTGVVVRVERPPLDDGARVANDRRVVRSLGAAQSVVIVQDGTAPAYAPAVLSYYAGRDVHAVYADHVPAAVTGPVVLVTAGGLNRIDGTVRALRADAQARARTSYDLYAHRSEGTINDRTPQSTPSGLGVVPGPMPGPFGEVASITVLAPFTYTFEHVPVAPGSRLVYVTAKVFPVGVGMRTKVRIEVAGGARAERDDELPPGPPAGPLAWELRSVPIPATRPTTARIVFSATSPSGRNVGDWAAFGAPAVVSR